MPMLPPLLEVYVVWHPDDDAAGLADALIDHFHGTAFSGLIGGAIEVFVRSDGWLTPGGAPRPLPFVTPLPNAIPAAELTVVVPVLGVGIARAVESGGAWKSYLDAVVEGYECGPEHVCVLPVRLPNAPMGGQMSGSVGQLQTIDFTPGADASVVCREVAQAVAQFAARNSDPLQVFISHTKRSRDDLHPPATLVRRVREVILDTRLREFFDASDLTPGRDWAAELKEKAATSALLAIRTDLYATREWCQKEVLTAKRAGMPVVMVDALARGEDRGSFLMDHVPRIPCRGDGAADDERVILMALGQLVDECLKRALWARQRELAERDGFGAVHWWAPHAPEPVTLTTWLLESAAGLSGSSAILILHPDPPLGRDELGALQDLASLCGVGDRLQILTPRGLSIRGA